MDLLFLENMMMDSFLLLFVSLFLRQPTTFLRILAASAAGSACGCIHTVWNVVLKYSTLQLWCGAAGVIQNIASTIISYVLLCMLMIFLAFGIHNKHILMKDIAVLYGAALFTGGVFSFLGNLMTPDHHLLYNNSTELPESGHLAPAWGCLLVFWGIALITGLAVIRAWRRGRNLSGNLYDMRLEFGKKTVRARVLLDTGNQLYEPAMGRPVTVIEKSVMDEIFKTADWEKLTGKCLCVPFHTVGQAHGSLKAVVADMAVIRQENTVWQYTDAVIGIYSGSFSRAGRYRGILHPEMLGAAHILYSGKKNFCP